MIFRQPNSRIYVSDQGFKIEFYGRSQIRYYESDKQMEILTEVGGESGIDLHVDSIHNWQPPYDNIYIDKNQRQQIVSNIIEILEFAGFKNINLIHY